MEYNLFDFIGNVGVFLVLLSFFLVQTKRLDATGYPYIFLNLIGAVFLLLSLLSQFNLSQLIINIVWVLISFVGIGRKLLESRVSRDAIH